MKRKEAIRILKSESEKIKNRDIELNGFWLTYLRQEIKTMLGSDSDYYAHARHLGEGHLSFEYDRLAMANLVDNAILHIERHGVYKPASRNVLANRSDAQLLWGLLISASIVFGFGYNAEKFVSRIFSLSKEVSDDSANTEYTDNKN